MPLTIRSACGGGYGDAGQHEQALWGQLAAIPGLVVAVPSIASDAAGLTLSVLDHAGPSVLLEHKLLSATWRDELGGGHRRGVDLDVPTSHDARASGRIEPVPLGRAAIRRTEEDVAIISVGVGVHRAFEAATRLAERGIDAMVVDLRTVPPLDVETVCKVAGLKTVMVVDEDRSTFGLSGEIAAVLAEHGITRPFTRVATTGVIPYARHLEAEILPPVARIIEATRTLTATPSG